MATTKNKTSAGKKLADEHQKLLSRYYDNWSLDSIIQPSNPPKPKPRRLITAALPVEEDDERWSDDHLEGMLDSRMGWDLEDTPFKDVMVRRLGEQAGVIVVTDKDIIVIKDDLSLFPSDTVVTQLRLLGSK